MRSIDPDFFFSLASSRFPLPRRFSFVFVVVVDIYLFFFDRVDVRPEKRRIARSTVESDPFYIFFVLSLPCRPGRFSPIIFIRLRLRLYVYLLLFFVVLYP